MKKFAGKFYSNGKKIQNKLQRFLKDQKAAREYSNEGYLMYGGIVIGIIFLGIILVNLEPITQLVMSFFEDGVTGNDTNPNGWGNRNGTAN